MIKKATKILQGLIPHNMSLIVFFVLGSLQVILCYYAHDFQSLIILQRCSLLNKMVSFLLTGCVWVYRIYQPIFDPLKKTNEDGSLNEQYCNKTVYTFAFWLITAAYIFLGLFTSCICCFSIVSVILKNEY